MADRILKGGCFCEKIRYEVKGEFQFVCQCCCLDCQKCTGTGHTTIIGIDKSQLTLHGEVQTYTTTADSGGRTIRHFCPVCAGRLYTSGDLPGDTIMIQSGSLDNPSHEAVRPTAVIYVKDAIAWDVFDPALPKHQVMPPPDDVLWGKSPTVGVYQGKGKDNKAAGRG